MVSVFATNDMGGKVYISEKVNLKFIPDIVSFQPVYYGTFEKPGISEILEFRDPGGTDRTVSADLCIKKT